MILEKTAPPPPDEPPEVSCVETVNPHGKNVPDGKAKGKGKGVNPDGFYKICVTDDNDPNPQLFVGTEDDPLLFELLELDEEGCIVIKFTEAPGATPSMKKIGSSNGQAGAVTWHITLPGEPVVTAIDASGNEASCTCLVPPPPK